MEIQSVWDVSVLEVHNIKGQTDQPAVIKNNGAVLIEENNNKYSVNCFLPLLEEKDKKIIPLIKSSLFQILMTYNLLNDADRIEQDSYQALLLAVYNFLSQKDDSSEWATKLKESIAETHRILFEDDLSEKKFCEDFTKKELLKSEKMDSKTTHKILFKLCQEKSFDPEYLKALLFNTLQENKSAV